MIQLAWKPRIFLYKKFLSDAECDHLINKGKKDITPSEVLVPAVNVTCGLMCWFMLPPMAISGSHALW